jgi:hypothetical protein
MSYFIDRLSEPSTWRGLAALAIALGIKLHPEMQEAIISTGLAVIGLINLLRKEHKP